MKHRNIAYSEKRTSRKQYEINNAEKCANNSDCVCLPEVVISPAAVALSPTKSEGPDRIPPMVLLELHKYLYIPLTILINNSIEK